ncbi:MAG TPA: hypothetical protein VKR06_37075 [Ktedonosporobacter sp.]|nr:hypothetical protein [Ktedonosporobacter sp.]
MPRDFRYDAAIAQLIASQQHYGGLVLPSKIKSILSPVGGPSVADIADYFREHQVDVSASERLVVVEAIGELTAYHDPITLLGVQRTVEIRHLYTVPEARIEEILSTIDADVVRGVVGYLRSYRVSTSPAVVRQFAQTLFQQDIADARIVALLEAEGIAYTQGGNAS